MHKDESKIPKGFYCYHTDKNGKKINCPYWSNDPNKPEQESGYCSFLEKSDQDINKEANEVEQKIIHCYPKEGKDKEVVYAPGTLPYPFNKFGLLWDQIKECGINEFTKEEESVFVGGKYHGECDFCGRIKDLVHGPYDNLICLECVEAFRKGEIQ